MDADARASAAAAEAQWDDLGAPSVSMDELGGPFEGPEKLLELWFAPSVEALPECQRALAERGARLGGRLGLRRVPRSTWEGMLDLVRCKTLSVETSAEVDAYLLSESSMFVYPHKLVLKTCGTTTLLLGLERLLRIAKATLFDEEALSLQAGSVSSAMLASSLAEDMDAKVLGSYVQHCFYSRKSFMFPDKQEGPHRDWELETALLDRYFDHGAAYMVGKMNGDHWFLYKAQREEEAGEAPTQSTDATLEILMTDLAPSVREQFYFDRVADANLRQAHEVGAKVSQTLGLDSLFANTQLDAFAFEPCGYSANALVGATPHHPAGYWTVHVTPEPAYSYASFETNVALECDGDVSDTHPHAAHVPGLAQRVVSTFQPGSLIFTLFVSKEDTAPVAALRSLELPGYVKRDRILYEFEEYELLFMSFQKSSA